MKEDTHFKETVEDIDQKYPGQLNCSRQNPLFGGSFPQAAGSARVFNISTYPDGGKLRRTPLMLFHRIFPENTGSSPPL